MTTFDDLLGDMDAVQMATFNHATAATIVAPDGTSVSASVILSAEMADVSIESESRQKTYLRNASFLISAVGTLELYSTVTIDDVAWRLSRIVQADASMITVELIRTADAGRQAASHVRGTT